LSLLVLTALESHRSMTSSPLLTLIVVVFSARQRFAFKRFANPVTGYTSLKRHGFAVVGILLLPIVERALAGGPPLEWASFRIVVLIWRFRRRFRPSSYHIVFRSLYCATTAFQASE